MIIKHMKGEIYMDRGVDPDKYVCHRCSNDVKRYFYKYYSGYHGTDVVYCLKCVNIGRSDSVTPLRVIHTAEKAEVCRYHLGFELSEAQQAASDRIVGALSAHSDMLLHAVTGAGKTEIVFEAISLARRRGMNVAFVSPRIDVVKEVHLRLRGAFRDSDIDLLYTGVKVEFEHRFTVCTVHQLYNYIGHFGLIIVDETDAFPMSSDRQLLDAVRRAAATPSTIVLMTATPNRDMVEFAGAENVVTLNRRYHGYDLAIPKVVWQGISKDVNKRRLPARLEDLIAGILKRGRRVLVFVPEIRMMEKLHPLVAAKFPGSDSVYSGDEARYRKVDSMRSSETRVLLTTTILERGVTFKNLDVIVVGAEMFNSDSLVQICGRTGRKMDDPVGNIWFMAAYNTGHIRRAIRNIRNFNDGRVTL
ncbi:MAG TPA: DEAD/DEAH box helicase family protein [Candidatus Salinicoccus stercoripullorum]|uniref:DEAD/DEAH box helicase family protein n=1 Tax=Candidatus Salinicoccus stercoripullorum TaxID=2838756 RepID=A0A9D1QHB3_9STAP|nr:DEAD/DEAH box helicase family protein [Candidatus Salinicoccus stercoripullorum]